MIRTKPTTIATSTPHPFIQAFPRLSLAIRFTAAVVRLLAGGWRRLWPYRRELFVVLVLLIVLNQLTQLGPVLGLIAFLLLLAGITAWPTSRTFLLGWLGCSLTRRWLITGLRNVRFANVDGQLPRVRSVRPTVVGERYALRLRAGHSNELLELRVEELRAALRARDVRLTRDPNHSHLVDVNVVRHDVLSTSGPVPWLHDDRDTLSIWEPVHFGVSELGRPIWLPVQERAILIGGNRGSGKSSAMNVFVAHAAKSPDAELLLIDANRLQLGPWQHRARVYAAENPDDAIGVLELAVTEMDRRLAFLESLPGIPLGLTANIAATYRLPTWILAVDELAYHCSVAGTRAQQTYFSATLRDIVARGRAPGIVPIAATQRPTHDLIPTSLRDLFDIRIAYRTMTRTSSDVVLGDEMAKHGFSATDIELDARGVNWLLAENREPIRSKTVWIPPERRAELAITTVRFKPIPNQLRPTHDQEVTP